MTHTQSTRHMRAGAFVLTLSAAAALGQIDATYIGPWGGQFEEPTHWDIGVVPVNTLTDTYNVIVPDSNYCHWSLMTGSFQVDDLSLGNQSYMDIFAGVDLTVLGDANYAGSFMRLYGGNLTLTNPNGLDNINARMIHAEQGAQLTLASTSYSSDGLGLVQLSAHYAGTNWNGSSLQTLTLQANAGAHLQAWYGGAVLDLSNVTSITWAGPGQLYAYAYDGTIDLSSLLTTDGPVRLHADLNGIVDVGNASLPQLTRIDCHHGSTINAPNVTTLEGVHYIVRGLNTVNLGAIASIDGAQFDIGEGATYTTTPTSYSAVGYGTRTPFAAQHAGSSIDASSIQSLELDATGHMNLNAWYGGAQLDLSGLDTITGGTGQLYAYAYDGSIDLSDLDSVAVRARIRSELNSTVDLGSTVVFDQLESLEVLSGSTINAPTLNDLEGVNITIASPSAMLNLGPNPQIQGAQFNVSNGANYTIPATSYSAVGYGTRTPFHAQHQNTVLDASAVQSLQLDATGNINLYSWYSGPHLDLSGLQTVTGGSGKLYVYAYDGTIDLTGLQNVEVRTHLDVDANGSISVSPTASFAAIEQIDVHHGGTMNLPGLTSLDNIFLNLIGTYTFNTGPITSADAARLWISEGAVYALPSAVVSYQTPTYNTTIFQALHAGSVLDLSSLDTIDVTPFHGYDVNAWYSGAHINLSNLNTIQGSYSPTYRLYFYAYDGSIDLSGLEHSEVNLSFNADAGGTITVGTDCVVMGGHPLIAVNNSTLVCGGNLIATAQGGANYHFDTGNVIMNGPGINIFEVAAEDVGLPVDGSELDDFRVGHLVIGDAAGFQTVVELRDCFDNGHRAGGTPEALYITGIDGQPGLEIASNAILALHGVQVYNWDGTQWVHLNALFGPGDQCISYAGGTLCLGDCEADFNRDGSLDFFDVLSFLSAFSGAELRADFTCDGTLDFFDVLEFLGDFSAGCP